MSHVLSEVGYQEHSLMNNKYYKTNVCIIATFSSRANKLLHDASANVYTLNIKIL